MRADHDISLPGICSVRRPNGSTAGLTPPDRVVTAYRSKEVVSGTNRRKPKGWMAPTGYSLLIRQVSYQRGSAVFAPNGDKSSTGLKFSGVIGSVTSGGRFNGENHFNSALTEANATAEGNLRDLALTRARGNLKQLDINLGIAFAERNRTARLVGDTTIRLSRSLQDLRRGRIRSAMNRLGISSSKREPRGGNVPRKWLELQYGWKPLLSDVYGACDALSKRDKDDWRVTAKGRASDRQEFRYQVNLGYPGGPYDGANVVARRDRRVYARIDALPQNEAIISLASLGITNPLLIGWELVPFSFVVDWFLPIGSWLESLDALLGYENAYYSSSFRVEAVWNDDFSQRIDAPSGPGYMSASYSGYKRLFQLKRSVSNSVPIPKFPRIKDPFSLGHMANGLALLTQVFRH